MKKLAVPVPPPTEPPIELKPIAPGDFKSTQLHVPGPEAPGGGGAPLPPEKDRYGHTFEELVAIQNQHLAALEMVMEPAELLRLRKWCTNRNKPTEGAVWPRGLHDVPRGVELFNWLLARGGFLLEMEG